MTGPGEFDPRFWDRCESLYRLFERRAKGELPEMESSKSVARLIKSHCGDRPVSLLDAGCGLCHYLISLKKVLPEIRYTGCDISFRYIRRGQELWQEERLNLSQASVGRLPFRDRSFDYVMCNNVLLHLPPPPFEAVKDLMRVSRDVTIIRTPISERTYFIKEIRNYDWSDSNVVRNIDAKVLDEHNAEFNYFNLYAREHLIEMIQIAASELQREISIDFRQDTDFRLFDNTKEAQSRTATQVVDGRQVSGSIITDWHFIIIKVIQ